MPEKTKQLRSKTAKAKGTTLTVKASDIGDVPAGKSAHALKKSGGIVGRASTTERSGRERVGAVGAGRVAQPPWRGRRLRGPPRWVMSISLGAFLRPCTGEPRLARVSWRCLASLRGTFGRSSRR